jgi:hypothetical protein
MENENQFVKVLTLVQIPVVLARVLLKSDKMVQRAAWTYWEACQNILNVSAGGASKTALGWRRSKGSGRSRVVRRAIRQAQRQGASMRQAERRAALIYDKFRHSKPGEPPRKITGFLRRNVVIRKMDHATYRVGLFRNAMYGFYLDQGTNPRPWILPALNQALPRIRNVVATSIGVR